MIEPVQITNVVAPQWIGNEYSTVCPFNADNSLLLLVENDHFILVDGNTGEFIQDLPIAAFQEPRWSRTHPKHLYFTQSNQLMKLIVGNAPGVDLMEVEYAFTEYTSISGRGKSDISRDGDHFVFCGMAAHGIQEVFTYQLSSGKKGPVFPQLKPFNNLQLTPSNQILLLSTEGIYVLGGPQLTTVLGHCAPTRYQGRDVLLFDKDAERENWQNALVMIDCEHPVGNRTVLMDFGRQHYAWHVSPCDKDLCLVSTYDPDNKLPMQIWNVALGGGDNTLVCATGGKYRDYNSQPKAALSRDGSRAVYSVDDGSTVNTWMVKLDAAVTVGTRINYAPYFGKSEFVMVPREDGAVDIYERKVS